VSTRQPMHCDREHFGRCSPSSIINPSIGSDVHQLQYPQ